jgi:hypothetical protein
MEDNRQNSHGSAANDGGDGNERQPPSALDYPDYESWCAGAEKYEAAEASNWRRQNIIAGGGVLVSTFTLAAAAVAAVIAYNAYVAALKAGDEARRQADEAKRQADAAEIQIGIAKDTAQKQLRAYLGTGLPIVDEKTETVIQYISNGGVTPARDVHVTYQSAKLLAGKTVSPDFTFPEGSGTNDIYDTVSEILPQGNQKHTAILDPGEIELLKDARKGGTPALMYGHIDYIDIFRNAHSCNFAFYMVKGGEIIQLERHNDCD